MSPTQSRPASSGVGRQNRLLAALDDRELRRLGSGLVRERFELKQILYQGGRLEAVYFPLSAVVSILTTMDDGSGVEIATIGNEGMVGVPVLLGATAIPARDVAQVQVPGELMGMETEAFRRAVTADGAFRRVLERYTQALFSQISQQVACNGLHSVEERCSRWLLLTHDRVGADEFPLTQEFLSQMLGVRRASVTVAAGALQRAGFIRFRRGRLTVLDREGLEGSSCECYRVIRGEFERLLGDR